MEDLWTTFGPELLLTMTGDHGRPRRRQLEDSLRDAIRDGRLAPGARVPSSRTLAADLGLPRGLVVDAYAQLVAEGYLTARTGSATRVAAGAQTRRPSRPVREPRDAQPRWDFRPSLPDPGLFPRREWGRALRRALSRVTDGELGYPDPRGVWALRQELATYLSRVRNVRAEPDRLVICNGFTQGLALVCRVLASRPGRLAVEDPGSPFARNQADTCGLVTVPAPVDPGGVVVSCLPAGDVAAALVTPAHHFPTGVVLTPERRAALLAWASDRVVIEDDYDAEFRYDGPPVGALQGLAPERVVYAGSVSKTLAPALRLGWLVVPGDLVDAVTAAKRDHDLGSAVLDQLAFLDLLATGSYDRHLRRVRRLYRAKRDVLIDALAQWVPQVRVLGIAAGLQVLIELPAEADEAAIARAATARSIGVYPLGRYRHAQEAGPAGLVLGYGALSTSEIADGVRGLADVLAR